MKNKTIILISIITTFFIWISTAYAYSGGWSYNSTSSPQFYPNAVFGVTPSVSGSYFNGTGSGTSTLIGGIISPCFATSTGQPCITGGGGSGSGTITAGTIGQLPVYTAATTLGIPPSNGNIIGGFGSGHSGSTGTNNVCIGGDTLSAFTSGSSNVCIGNNAGAALTTGGSNVLLGLNAGTSLKRGTNDLFIMDDTSSTSISNFGDIGDSIFITGIPNGGGMTAPFGQVSIDTITPNSTSALTVNGNGYFSQATAGSVSAVALFGQGLAGASGDTGTSIAGKFVATSTHISGNNIGIYCNAAGGSANYCFDGEGGQLYNSGTAHIAGNVQLDSQLTVTGITTLNGSLSGNGTSNTFNNGVLYVTANGVGVNVLPNTSSVTVFYVDDGNGQSIFNINATTDAITTLNNTLDSGNGSALFSGTTTFSQNVGISSSTPSARLSIMANSSLASTGPVFVIASSSSTNTGTTTLFQVSGSGSTEIGSSTGCAGVALCIQGVSSGNSFAQYSNAGVSELTIDNVGNLTGRALSGGSFRGTTLGTAAATIFNNNVNSNAGVFFPVSTSTAISASGTMVATFRTIGSSVEVGIATATPDSTFDVNGNVRFEGNSTVITPSISGTITTAGCDSATSSVDASVSSTTAFVTTPETYPGDDIWWESYYSAPSTITTKVCADVTVTPLASIYVVKIIK